MANAQTRSDHSLIFYDDKIWLFSGKSNCSIRFTNSTNSYATLFYDLDSTNSYTDNKWHLDSYGAPALPRHGYTTTLFNNKIICIGGYSSSGPQNDVWEFEVKENN